MSYYNPPCGNPALRLTPAEAITQVSRSEPSGVNCTSGVLRITFKKGWNGNHAQITVVMVLVGVLAAACGGSSNPATAPSSASATDTWSGTLADSTTPGLGTGGMMGQAGMGTMTLRLVQNGSNVTGTMAFAGMGSGMMQGTMIGAMSNEDVTFTMNIPAGSMMSGGCSAQSTGTAHMNGTTMTMTGNYSGTNSCSGSFDNGQMTMGRK